jgi:hypothetical protein
MLEKFSVLFIPIWLMFHCAPPFWTCWSACLPTWFNGNCDSMVYLTVPKFKQAHVDQCRTGPITLVNMRAADKNTNACTLSWGECASYNLEGAQIKHVLCRWIWWPTVTRLWVGRLGNLFSVASRIFPGTTQRPEQWLPDALPSGVKLIISRHVDQGQEWVDT